MIYKLSFLHIEHDPHEEASPPTINKLLDYQTTKLSQA